MAYNAILFDIDGTLVNNVHICTEAYRITFKHFTGRLFADEEFVPQFGMAEEGILAFHLPELPLSDVSDKYFAAYEELHQDVREPFNGLRQTIEHLHKSGIPIGVVTGKGERGAYATLRMLGLLPFFQVIETGCLEGANKPESLRRAAQRLGLAPHQVVYVGDTGYDVASASAIGMPIVGAGWSESTTLTPENASKALHVFKTIEAFHEWAVTTFCATEAAS